MICGNYRVFTETCYFDVRFSEGECYSSNQSPRCNKKFLFFTDNKLYVCHFRVITTKPDEDKKIRNEFIDYWDNNKSYYHIYDEEFLIYQNNKLIINKPICDKDDREYFTAHACHYKENGYRKDDYFYTQDCDNNDYDLNTNQGDYYCHTGKNNILICKTTNDTVKIKRCRINPEYDGIAHILKKRFPHYFESDSDSSD